MVEHVGGLKFLVNDLFGEATRALIVHHLAGMRGKLTAGKCAWTPSRQAARRERERSRNQVKRLSGSAAGSFLGSASSSEMPFLKALMPLPRPLPISAKRLGPKISATTTNTINQ